MARSRSIIGNRPMLALLGLAFAMKALVPSGWMPVFDDGVRLELCGGWQPGRLAQPASEPEHDSYAGDHHAGPAPSDHHGDKDAPEQAGDLPCTFAASAMAWLGVDEGPAVEGAAILSLPVQFPAAVGIGRGLAAPPPPSTGPPLRS